MIDGGGFFARFPASMTVRTRNRLITFSILAGPFVFFFSLLLFWDAEPEEGFAPQAHWLFDASVTHYLDLEAMLFLVEHLMERLMSN